MVNEKHNILNEDELDKLSLNMNGENVKLEDLSLTFQYSPSSRYVFFYIKMYTLYSEDRHLSHRRKLPGSFLPLHVGGAFCDMIVIIQWLQKWWIENPHQSHVCKNNTIRCYWRSFRMFLHKWGGVDFQSTTFEAFGLTF